MGLLDQTRAKILSINYDFIIMLWLLQFKYTHHNVTPDNCLGRVHKGGERTWDIPLKTIPPPPPPPPPQDFHYLKTIYPPRFSLPNCVSIDLFHTRGGIPPTSPTPQLKYIAKVQKCKESLSSGDLTCPSQKIHHCKPSMANTKMFPLRSMNP